MRSPLRLLSKKPTSKPTCTFCPSRRHSASTKNTVCESPAGMSGSSCLVTLMNRKPYFACSFGVSPRNVWQMLAVASIESVTRLMPLPSPMNAASASYGL